METEWRRDAFASVYRDGYFAHLIDLPDQQSGVEVGLGYFPNSTTEYFRIFEVMRDYGMQERKRGTAILPARQRAPPSRNDGVGRLRRNRLR